MQLYSSGRTNVQPGAEDGTQGRTRNLKGQDKRGERGGHQNQPTRRRWKKRTKRLTGWYGKGSEEIVGGQPGTKREAKERRKEGNDPNSQKR